MRKPTLSDFRLTIEDVQEIENFNNTRFKNLWIITFFLYIISILCVWFFGGKELAFNVFMLSFFLYGVGLFSIKFIVGLLYPVHSKSEILLAYKKQCSDYNSWFVRTQSDFWLSLNGLQFEKEVTDLLIRLGHNAVRTKSTGDGGVDIIIYSPNNGITLVQCKAHKKPIGPHAIRDLYGVMNAQNAPEGMLISLGGFTIGVNKFLKENNIKNIGLFDLSHLIKLQSGLG